MNTPFPGMDPWLEHPILWPDVHNRLIAALADVIAPLIAPHYFIRLERRVYLVHPSDADLAGVPDLNILRERLFPYVPVTTAPAGAFAVDLPAAEEVEIGHLAVYAVDAPTKARWLVTVIEVLSPVNKLSKEGRQKYLEKRAELLGNRTNLVEIDLLRAGEPLPMTGDAPRSDYRVVVARGWRRPHAYVYPCDLRDPLPDFPLPLQRGEAEPLIPLNATLHALYTRARYDLELDYTGAPKPPLRAEDAEWAQQLVRLAQQGEEVSG
jgi:hypothetical protein